MEEYPRDNTQSVENLVVEKRLNIAELLDKGPFCCCTHDNKQSNTNQHLCRVSSMTESERDNNAIITEEHSPHLDHHEAGGNAIHMTNFAHRIYCCSWFQLFLFL